MSAIQHVITDSHQSEGVRRRRHLEAEADRLRRSVEALVRANRSVSALGRNEEIEELARDLGFDGHEFVCLDVRVRNRRASLVCVPTRLWNRAGAMAMFFALKSAAMSLGHRVVIVPETFIRRQPRLENSIMVSAAAHVEVNATDRMVILEFLLEHGGGTLSEVASLIRHPDPVAAVLHLVTVGALDIDLNAPILPATEIRFASAPR